MMTKILSLDETIEHLDAKNEKIINFAIESLKVTNVVIARRCETILSCDKIFRLINKGLINVTSEFKVEKIKHGQDTMSFMETQMNTQ
ncbi:MAG: hypothetical protein AAGB12_13630 [Pseudomonadota bacterium]